MKSYCTFILFVFISTLAFAQSDYQEVVYLKNGSIIRGVIIEQVPNQSIKIQTADKSVFVYRMDEVEKLTKEQNQRKNKDKILLSTNSGDEGMNGIRFGVKGGLNLSNIFVKDNEETYSEDYKWKPGFHLGITAELPITDKVFFETGLLLSTKGFKTHEEETFNGETEEHNSSVNLLYLDLPLTAKTYLNVGRSRLFGTFGPYIGYGLSGKSKYENTINGKIITKDEEDINWGSGDDDEIKHLDFGLSAGLGVEMGSIQIGLSYNMGLANMITNSSGGQTAHNKNLSLSVAYKFGKK